MGLLMLLDANWCFWFVTAEVRQASKVLPKDPHRAWGRERQEKRVLSHEAAETQ